MNDREELLQFYRDELSYLRHRGREFKDQYSKLASRLELGDDECADPHVERLIPPRRVPGDHDRAAQRAPPPTD
jgi:type VI protein secretion system component VasA